MSLSPGTRLGAYEIIGLLGEGGMGQVYRARDARLDRYVAIKMLPDAFVRDPVRLARFEAEAKSIAALSHPNILAIFDVGHLRHEDSTGGDAAFLVMELLEGQTLRERLADGALPPRKAVDIAIQLCRGLTAAHDKGIVHRDLKPENLFLTADGQVKILDFGLAKSTRAEAGSADQETVAALTDAGMAVGTVGYMAPEQVRSQPIDARTDLFSLGAVLYEMLSGQRPFRRDTAAETMTAILKEDPPDLTTVRADLPPALERIVRHCLEKTPADRFQSARDVAFALGAFSTASAPGTSISSPAVPAPARPATRSSWASWLPWAIAAIAVVAALALWLTRAPARSSESPWSTFTRITEAAGEETSPSLSPDGNMVIYSMRVNGSWDIYSQRVGGRNATPVVNDPQRDERGPAFSPDGALIAFHESDSDGGVFVAGATGESVRRLTTFGFDPAWSPDGQYIAFDTEEVGLPAGRKGQSTIYIVPASGGKPRKILGDDDGIQPSWSPSGDRIVYWSNTGGQRDIYTVPIAGGSRIAVTQDPAIDWCPIWSSDGHFIYFSSDRGGQQNLWRIAVDMWTGKPIGTPEPVTTSVQADAALPSLSKNGNRLAFRSRVGSINPVAIPFDPSTLKAGTPFLLDARNNIRVPSDVSPDDKQIAYFAIGERQEDIFVGPLSGGMRRVTDDVPRDRGPQFSPDGRSLIFYSARDGNWAAWTIQVDGGNLRKLAGPSVGVVNPFPSPKGDRVVFTGSTDRRVYAVPFPDGGTPQVLEGTIVDGKSLFPTCWSPDGTRLAGPVILESGNSAGIATYDLATHAMTIVAADDTSGVRWLADGRHLMYFAKGWQLVLVDVASRTRTVVDVKLPAPSVDDIFGLSRDNRMIYYGAVRAEADIWIMERK